jgi:hypothetical protein
VNQGAASQIAYTYDGAGNRVLSVGNGQNTLEFTALDGLLWIFDLGRRKRDYDCLLRPNSIGMTQKRLRPQPDG